MKGTGFDYEILDNILTISWDHRHGDIEAGWAMILGYVQQHPEFKIFNVDEGSDQIVYCVAINKEVLELPDEFTIEEVVKNEI